MCSAGRACIGNYARNIDNPAARLFTHLRGELTASQKRTREIDVQDPSELLRRQFPRDPVAGAAGQSDQSVERAERASDTTVQFGSLGFIREVGMEEPLSGIEIVAR